MLKYLRIAVTALSLTACVLLIALWVRSYWYYECVGVRLSPAHFLALRAGKGTMIVSVRRTNHYIIPLWYHDSHEIIEGGLFRSKARFEVFLYLPDGERWPRRIVGQGLLVPCWLPVAICATVAIALLVPREKKRCQEPITLFGS
jgi:hypothetical protein